MSINQIELITAICKHLDKCGHEYLNARQLNAVIEAANIIVREVEKPHMPATKGMGYTAWTRCDDVGASSRYMAHVMIDAPACEYNYPHDIGDFYRCIKFLEAINHDDRVPLAMSDTGKEWKGIIDNWKELYGIYLANMNGDKSAGKTFNALIDKIIREVRTP